MILPIQIKSSAPIIIESTNVKKIINH